MARFLKANGEEIQVFPTNGETFTWEELEGYVGGSLAMIGHAEKNETFWVLYNYENEIAMMERRQPNLPYNAHATALTPPGLGIEFFGDVLYASESEWNDDLYHQYLEENQSDDIDPEDDYDDVY